MKRLMLVGALAAAVAACDSGPSAPRDAAGSYLARMVNGHALPAVIENYTSPDGKACSATLVEGYLNLYGEQLFDLDLSLRRACDGVLVPPGEDRTTGTYTQSGSRVTFQTQLQGITHVTSADVVGSELHLRGVRNSGTTLDLVFLRP